jgi:hypothetical protein
LNDTVLGIIAGGVGLIAAFGGVAAMLRAMGYFEYLGGRKISGNSAILSKGDLELRLLALNSPDLPYRIQASEESDLSITWNIADANWYGLFSKEHLSETYRAFILLDEVRRSVRYYEQLGRVQWSAGLSSFQPSISYVNTFFKGRVIYQKSWAAGFGKREDGTIGKVYEYKYDMGRLRDPLVKAVIESGWEFVPVLRKKNATYS